MSKVSVIAKLTATEGQRDALVKVMEALVDAAADEKGTELYVLSLDKKDENTVWVYELYTDRDAFAEHGNSDAMKAAMGQFGGLLAGPADLIFNTPVRAAGVDV